LNLPVLSFTQEKLDRLKAESDKYEQICAELESQTELDLWNHDIDAFSQEWDTEMAAWSARNSLGGATETKKAPAGKITLKPTKSK
jgi:DNA topoisomerase-2